jgi:diguanylate cyclase (GGDEF)-like protein
MFGAFAGRPVSNWLSRPNVRVGALSALLAGAAVALFIVGIVPLERLPLRPAIPWPLIAVGYFFFDLPAVRIRSRRGVLVVAPTEMALVYGLLLTAPVGLVVARLLSAVAAAIFRGRHDPTKAVFNVVRATVVACGAILVFRALLGDAKPLTWSGSAALLLTVAIVDLAGTALVAVAISTARGKLTAPIGFADAAFVLTAALLSAAVAEISVVAARDSLPALLTVVAAGVIVAVAIRIFAGLRRRHQALESLYEFTRDINSTVDTEDHAELVARLLRDAFRADGAALVRYDERDGIVVTTVGTGGFEPSSGGAADKVAFRGALRQVAHHFVESGATEADLEGALRSIGLVDALAAPFDKTRAGLGFIAVFFRRGEGRATDESETDLLHTMSQHVASVLERDRLLSEVQSEAAQRQFEATHDPLTGLANRTLLAQEIRHLTESHEDTAALLLLDLDRFKDVNDTLGHDSGDLLLLGVANRIRSAVGRNDLIARLGGDEFAVVARDLPSEAAVLEFAHQLFLSLQNPHLIAGLNFEVPASIGIARIPSYGIDFGSLLRRADVAMYEAKRRRMGAMMYHADFDRHSRGQLSLGADMRSAVNNGEFQVAYQPIVSLPDTGLVGVEALARWADPRFEHLGPHTFVPLAEHAGLIGPLTILVLKKSLEACARWRKSGLVGSVHVNLSPLSLTNPSLLMQLPRLLDTAGLSPSALTLEVTEGGLMTDVELAARALRRIRRLGVRVAIDDFGVGHSSLAYLQRLPVDVVKLDKSLVSGIATSKEDLVVVSSAIELAHGLNLWVVAEGVETAAVRDRLASVGCDAMQGFFMSPPLAPEAFESWCNRDRVRSDLHAGALEAAPGPGFSEVG